MDIKMYLDTSKDWDAADIKADKLTHLIVLSAQIGNDFRMSCFNNRLHAGVKNDIPLPENVFSNALPNETWGKITELKTRYPALKIIVSVGGINAEGFSDMAASSATRRIFAESAVKFIDAHRLDGIDINWQYPTVPLRGHIKTRPQDKENFIWLLKELRDAIGKGPELSFCASPSEWFIDAIDLYEATRYVDNIHLLTYGMSGIWDTETRHHTNLYISNEEPYPHKAMSLDKTVARYKELGVPPEVLSVAYAAYGIEFRGVADPGVPQCPGLYRKFVSKDSVWQNGCIPYSVLEEHYIDKFGYTRFFDVPSGASYLYSESEKAFISYDDPASVKEKAAYAQKMKLKGLICYEYTHDTSLTLLKDV